MEKAFGIIRDLTTKANNAYNIGNFEAAKNYYKTLLKDMEQIYPLYHYEYIDIYLKIAYSCQRTMNSIEAFEYFLKYENSTERLVSGQKQLALVRIEIALAYIKDTLYEKALNYLLSAKRYIESHCDIEETKKLFVSFKIGECYYYMNNYKSALPYLETLGDYVRGIFGSKNLETCSFYVKLGTCYTILGNYSNAVTSLGLAKKIYKKNKHNEKLVLTTIFELLGNNHNKLGNLSKSIKYINKCKSLQENSQTNENSNTWVLHMNMGNNMCKQGKYEQALGNYEKCLNLISENPNGENWSITELYLNLGILYRNKGMRKESLKYLKKCKELREQDCGVHSLALGEIYYHYANFLNDNNDYNQAIHYYDKYKDIVTDHFPINDPRIIEANVLLVNALMAVEDYNKSLEVLKSFNWLELCDKDADFIAGVYNKMTTCLISEEKVPRALLICKNAKNMMDKAKIFETVNYADCLYNLALCYEKSNNMQESFKYYKECEKIIRNTHLNKSFRHGKLFLKLGVMNFYYKNFEVSLDYLIGSLKIHGVLLKPNDKSFIPIFFYLGSVHFALENFTESIFYLRKSKDLQVLVDFGDKKFISKTLLCLGGSYLSIDLSRKAYFAFKECEKLKENTDENDFIGISNVKNNIAICMASRGDTEQALKVFKESVSTAEKVIPNTNPLYIRLYFNISKCYFILGGFSNALDYLINVKNRLDYALNIKHPDLISLYMPSDWPIVLGRKTTKNSSLINFVNKSIRDLTLFTNNCYFLGFNTENKPLFPLVRKMSFFDCIGRRFLIGREKVRKNRENFLMRNQEILPLLLTN